MTINPKDISILIIGLIINLVVAYLYYIQLMNTTILVIIVVGSIVFAMIMGFQLKMNDNTKKLENFESEQKRLTEKLKIHEQLIEIKSDIKELKK